MSSPPPLIICIGPPCSGKTTFLHSVYGSNLVDCCIDDGPGVYEVIPNNFARSTLGMDVAYYAKDDKNRFRDHRTHKILLSDRLKTDYFEGKTEQLIFLLLLNKDITVEQALQDLRSPWCINDNDEDSFNLFIELMMMIQEELNNGLTMTSDHVQLFIPETLDYSIMTTKHTLTKAATFQKDVVVASGNTNTKVGNYRPSLFAAEKSGRPVRFIRWSIELPRVSLVELYRRNIGRFAATGKFVPLMSILIHMERCDSLLFKFSEESEESQYSMTQNISEDDSREDDGDGDKEAGTGESPRSQSEIQRESLVARVEVEGIFSRLMVREATSETTLHAPRSEQELCDLAYFDYQAETGLVAAQPKPVSTHRHYSQQQNRHQRAAGDHTVDVETVLKMSGNGAPSSMEREPIAAKQTPVAKKVQPDVNPKAQNSFASLFDNSDEED